MSSYWKSKRQRNARRDRSVSKLLNHELWKYEFSRSEIDLEGSGSDRSEEDDRFEEEDLFFPRKVKATHTNGFFKTISSTKLKLSYDEPLTHWEFLKSKSIVKMILLAGFCKNESSIVQMLPIEILRIICHYVEGLSVKQYRLYMKERGVSIVLC
jgi:hypothetical protein